MPTSLATKGEGVFKGQRKGNTNRLQPYRQEQVRAQIQVRQILNLIQDHVVNGTEISSTRLHFGMKLIDKVLPNAIPDVVSTNLQANTLQALQSINQEQLTAMAREMLVNQGVIIDATGGVVDSDSERLLTVDNSSVSEQSHDESTTVGGVGQGGVGGVVGVATTPLAQEQSKTYPDHLHILPDELG